ncbi:MAG: DEAD/DEAH box helicase [archaeon]
MKLEEISKKYPALADVVQRVQEIDRIDELFPPQKEAIESGVFEGKNLVLSIPTASGKTLIAELAMLNQVLKGGKALYTAPLRALAFEKFEDMKEKYSEFAKIGISTGDYDSSGAELAGFDIVILTNEKLDSIMRHGQDWLRDVRLVVLDEVHLIDSVNRGPAIEMVATRLKSMKVQMLALSATIENSDEIAEWLEAELVESEFRPIKLSRGVYLDGEVTFSGKADLKISGGLEPSKVLALDIVKNGAQSLVFVNTRKGAEKEAEETGKKIYEILDTKEKKELSKLSEQVLNVLDSPTRQCKRLSDCVRQGTAFHHAGLHQKQRMIVEKNYKNNLIKVISATPTLAAGVNLPGKRVIVRDYRRYGNFGMEPIPILEVHQMFGRAGRPKYDNEGEAILIAKNEEEFDMLWEHYVEGSPEPISSKLGVEPVMRTHVLGLLAQLPWSKENLYEFFEKTFYAHQFGDMEKLEELIDRVLDQLFDWGFVNRHENMLGCTKLGRRVAELYLDPLTAWDFLQLFEREKLDEVVLLTVLSDSAEMRPIGTVRRSEEVELYEQFEKYDLVDEQFRAFRNAYIFFEWMNEVTDDKIYDKYGLPPGVLHGKLTVADWLLYACSEIARLAEREKIVPMANTVRKRLKYGVKMELLPLVRIKNIGRVRARTLHSNGIKGIEDIKKAGLERVSKLIGVKVAKNIFDGLE